MSAETLIISTGVATVILTGLGLLFTLRSVRDQLWLQMFSEYTRRYHEIVRELPSESRDPDGTFDFDELESAERGDVLNAARGYVNLCSEEYYLYRRGRIDKETWSIWSDGIEEVFRLPWLRQTWSKIRHEYASYEPFCAFLDKCIEAKEPLAKSQADEHRHVT